MLAMRESRGKIRCVPALTPEERNLKSAIYREAKRLHIQVKDKVDIMVLEKVGPNGKAVGTTFQLDTPEDEVLHRMRSLSTAPVTPPTRPTHLPAHMSLPP